MGNNLKVIDKKDLKWNKKIVNQNNGPMEPTSCKLTDYMYKDKDKE